MNDDARCPAHPSADLLPALQHARDHFYDLGEDFSYSRCVQCSTLVQLPRPAPDEIGAYYAGYYPAQLLEHLRQRARRGRPQVLAARVRAMGYLRQLERLGVRHDSNTRLLDVGCGLGAFARYARSFGGVDVRGVDFSPECREFAQEVHGVEVDVGELKAQAYADASFDLLTAWHYIEHVYDPAAELVEMQRVLKPGGWLMLETPTPGPLGRLFGRRWFHLLAPTHLYLYRPAALVELLEQAGFVQIQVSRPWFPGELAGSILFVCGVRGFFPKLFSPRRPLRHRLLGLALLLQMLYDIPITLGLALLGQSGLLRVFARKPGAEPST